MKWPLVFGAVVIISTGTYFYFEKSKEPVVAPYIQEISVVAGKPVFTWSYREYMEEDIPQTEISLTAAYENSVSDTRIIDRVEGSCNTYEEEDDDVYENSSMIICYYAGLGRYFKITQNEQYFAVQRRIFEEGSPDYSPPILPYETITTF